MKRIQLFCVAAVLLLTGTVSADLTVYEYVPGEKVTQDSVTGDYWYWNLADFVGKTYAQQMTQIAGLGNYGNLTGGWHMATRTEMDALWNHDATSLQGAFAITAAPNHVRGRYEESPAPTYHYFTGWSAFKYSLGGPSLSDGTSAPWLGAYVTTDAAVVPAPGALVLAASGLLSVLGVNRWRRKSQGPGYI